MVARMGPRGPRATVEDDGAAKDSVEHSPLPAENRPADDQQGRATTETITISEAAHSVRVSLSATTVLMAIEKEGSTQHTGAAVAKPRDIMTELLEIALPVQRQRQGKLHTIFEQPPSLTDDETETGRSSETGPPPTTNDDETETGGWSPRRTSLDDWSSDTESDLEDLDACEESFMGMDAAVSWMPNASDSSDTDDSDEWLPPHWHGPLRATTLPDVSFERE